MLTRRRFMSTVLGAAGIAALPRSFALAQTRASVDPIDPELWRYLSLSPLAVAHLVQGMPLLAGNAQLQAEAMGIPLPVDMTDEAQRSAWVRAMYNVGLPSIVATNGRRDDFTSLTGFEIAQVASGAEIGEPPSVVTFLRGSFDVGQIQATQLELGYRQLDVDGHPVFSLSETADIDLSNPVQRMAFAHLNNSAVLDDGTLVYATTLELIQTVFSPGMTLASLPEVERAMATLDTPLIASALLGPDNFLPGIPVEMFDPSITPNEIATAVTERIKREPAPIVLAAIAGNSPGGPAASLESPTPGPANGGPKSVSKFALVYATPEDATVAAAQIQERLATGTSVMTQQPWTELFAATEAVPNLDQASVLLTMEWIDRAASTTNLIFQRDLGFITG
jgi:hypothetical protein